MEFTDSGDILALAVAEKPLSGRWLLIQPDSAQIETTLRARGADITEWSWMWSNRNALTWPPANVFDGVILRLPTIRELTTLAIEVAASRLAPGGPLLIYGANHEGIKSVQDHLAPWFEAAETILYKHRERVVSAVRSAEQETLRTHLADWQRTFEAEIAGETVSFISYPGMFAHGTLDQGTALLLAHLPRCAEQARVLDMGTGTGVLAYALQMQAKNLSIDAVDVNAFAIEATKENVPGVNGFFGDSWNALPPDAKYDLIVSNPPVHQGAKQTTQTLEYFIAHAKQHLKADGLMTLVVQGTIPVKKYFDRAGLRSTLIAEDTTYQVWQAR